MRKGFINYASLAVVIAAALSASTAAAQTASGAGAPPDPANDTAQSTPETQQRATGNEIVVTATKRDENLSEVPIQVNVVTGAEVRAAGIVRPQDFLISTPNVTFVDEGTGDSFTNIRGQTSIRNSDPNVAVVIDGVQLSSLKQFNQDLFNIAQIEILKGPQSALYGRNAAAGAIVITTKRPSDFFEGNVLAGYGSWNSIRAQADVSGPLSDTLSFSLAGSTRDTDGPFTNITTGEKPYRLNTSLGQGRLLWTPSPELEVDLKVSGHTTKGGATALQTQLVGLPIGGVPVPEIDVNRTDLPFVTNVAGKLREDLIAASLRVEYDMGFARLTSVSAFDDLYQFFGGDSPPYIALDSGTPGAIVQGYTYRDRNLSQEFRLTSPDDQRFRWQVGVYFLDFKRNQISELNQDLVGIIPPTDEIDPPGDPILGGTVSYARQKYTTKSFAPFASVQFDITDTTHLSVAGRYDIEKRTVREIAPDMINPLTGANYNLCIAVTGQSLDQCRAERTFKQFEPKISLLQEFDFGSVYASYGKGFKSGGFNPIGSRALLLSVAPPGAQVFVQDQFDKEVSESYEIGTKLELFDRILTFNAAAFTTEVKNAQQFEFFPSAGLQTTTQIDKVRLRGFEFDFAVNIPDGPRIFGGYGYTDGEVTEFAPNPAFEGNRSPNTIKYNLSLGATQEFELGGDLQLVPRIGYTKLGSIWWDVGNTAGTKRDPVDLVDARLSLRKRDRWDISIFAKNLFNEKYNRSVLPLLGVLVLTSRAETRFIGAEASYSF